MADFVQFKGKIGPRYDLDESGEHWWCKNHRRRATHVLTYSDGRKAHHCDPSLGGIMLPCDCVQTDDADACKPDQSERAVIMATLENVMAVQQAQEKQISTLIAVISELQAHVSDLEHKAAEAKRKRRPAIFNAVGERAN